ncbi:hypothetical protein, partial [Citrobacter freundii]|uniref:hypothetical protein n=3 Tax=Enterobacterales TaxID=91347 RepID=UPI001C3D1D94
CAHDMPPGSLNGPVKLTIARTSELSHRRTLLLSHYNLGALNEPYVELWLSSRFYGWKCLFAVKCSSLPLTTGTRHG